MKAVHVCALLAGVAAGGSMAATAADQAPSEVARMLGARPYVTSISISPDGRNAAFIGPTAGHGTAVAVIDLAEGRVKTVAAANGAPLNFVDCGWSSPDRLACEEYGITSDTGQRLSFTRSIAFDADGGHPLYIGRRARDGALGINQYDGSIIDWRSGDGTVLMARRYVPEETTGTMLASSKAGLGVDSVDTRTGRTERVEEPRTSTESYLADGQGNIRIMVVAGRTDAGILTGVVTYLYRLSGSRDWRLFGRAQNGSGDLAPIAVDGTRNVAFATRRLNGRDALYSVALDGTMKTILVSDNPQVDVEGVVTVGRRGRVIGATYVTDRRQIEYFDEGYRKLADGLARALPKTPLIEFVSADADEQRLIVYASSDIDPGRYYLFDRASHKLSELVQVRPALAKATLSPVTAVSYPAADGTTIPAYLTLPTDGARKGLPAIVMPHGGPASRDEWGFDWLAQFFAQRGYAVIQPEYRGSTGYGEAWFAKNGFRSWQTAIGDVCDAGRWLVKQGIAAPGRLAIVGWSYGGYAALQANVVDPDLFKAAVAVAPVTDLAMIESQAYGFANSALVARQIGSGPQLVAGSPDRHADRFKAPVLMFHGDNDLTVDVAESRVMDAALRRAGKQSTLVVFPGLDHQLDDSDARAQMLDRADRFLRTTMKM